jgi:hypothetical protein
MTNTANTTRALTPELIALRLEPGEAGTVQTLAAMQALVDASAKDARVVQRWKILREYQAIELGTRAGADSVLPPWRLVWHVTREHVRFAADPKRSELIREPLYALDMLDDARRRAQRVARIKKQLTSDTSSAYAYSIPGDCDDRAVLGAVLCRLEGYEVAFVTIADAPGAAWKHVLWAIRGGPVLGTPRDEWYPMDPQEADAPGRMPEGRIGRSALWVLK